MLFTGFAQFLLVRKLLTSDVLEKLLNFCAQKNVTLVTALLEHKSLSEKMIAEAAASYFHCDFCDLDTIVFTDTVLNLLKKDFVLQHKVLPIGSSNNQLLLAIHDPSDFASLNTIKFHLSQDIIFVVTECSKLNNYLQKFLAQSFGGESSEDQSAITIVDKILTSAINDNASDIHLEPYADEYRIRFRIDGVLYKKMSFALTAANQIVSRLKVLSKLDIAEKRLPQDGRFSFSSDQNVMRECRISSIPITCGEKIAVRLLNPNIEVLNLNSLGLENVQKEILTKYISLPQGMIIVTGPTGSGKTQTLLTAINALNNENKNISTVEDPVEIVLSGVNQVEVNQKIGLTFANVLRSFLRQDPDIIMVGEIRDLETAEIAAKASETGHLVLSSLHTNTASEAIVRLCNMGLSSFHFANSINLIIAQRLLRKLCVFCKKQVQIDDLTKPIFGSSLCDENHVIYQASGCNKCEKGYKGRIGVFEFLPISEAIRLLILQGNSASEIFTKAEEEGMLALRAAALMKVLHGVTSLEEVARVIGL